MTDDYTRAVPAAGEAPSEPIRTSALHAPALDDASTSGAGAGTESGGAAEKAKNVAGSAGDAASSLLGEARSGASDVKQEAQRQVRDLWDQTRSELADQTSGQQQRLATGLRSFGDQLGEMASAPAEPGVASDLARDLGRRAGEVGDWLEGHGPQDVLEEVRSFARRRPGTFLLVAAGAGLLVGRLTRALKDSPSQTDAPSQAGPTPADREYPSPPVSSYESTPTAATYGGGGL
ncbi:hypothetical protein [Cellulomonas sp. PhB150]|uniref:hypothetical protein n=1 Tax=Cellulomonas sp. PhB150 TaxID=2485188 RepID=UPI000F4824CA|nr:hypothetical protein [Cellulomonas sp. PhB150]ROS26063.1 hypothetical protein EDF34_2392 [Cellulomonas sp. PhB150]